MKLYLPYFSEKSVVTVRNEVVEIKAFQIIVWVSVATKEANEWDPRLPKFPAIFDTGNTHNFSLTNDHLKSWAGIPAASLPEIGRIRKEGTKAPLRNARLWLHTDGDPFNLKVDEGITVFDGDWPRLLILGLRALTKNKLRTFLYGDTMQVLIRTRPKWYWPF